MRTWAVVKSLFLAAFVLLLGGCKASAGGKINSGGDADAHASFEGDGQEDGAGPNSGPEPLGLDTEDPNGTGSLALLGARHDLFLESGAPTATCSCMRVFAGQPRAAQFSWQGPVPRIDASSQLVIAFTSHGQVCENEPPDSQGAAYHGYEKRGADVVVMVEAAAPGRPLVGGAILPRPDPGGRLLIRAVPAGLPYGKPTNGAGSECEVPSEPVGTAAPALAEPDLVAAGLEDDDGADQEPLESLENDPNHPVDGSDEISSRREGFYLGAILGPGYLRLSSDTEVASGVGFDFDLMIGGSPVRDLAIGVALGGLAVPEPTFEQEDGSEFDGTDINMNLVHFGLFADYYPIEDSNFHALLGFGYDAVTFSGSGANGLDERADGFGVALGLGYDFWVANRWSLGFLGRVKASFVEFPDSSATGVSPVLGFTATFH